MVVGTSEKSSTLIYFYSWTICNFFMHEIGYFILCLLWTREFYGNGNELVDTWLGVMLPLRLATLLLLFLLPLACPKPRPGHYLIETEDGGEDDSVGDSLDNGNNNSLYMKSVVCRYFCNFNIKIFIRSVSTHQHKKQGIWEMDWWRMDSPFAQLLDYWYLLMTEWLDDWMTGSFVDDVTVYSLFPNYKYHMYFVLCGM